MKPCIVLDSIQTCLSLEPLRDRLNGLGLRGDDLELWFAHSVRDAFAHELVGTFKPFKELQVSALTALLRWRRLPARNEDVEALVESFAELPAHDDVRPALELAAQQHAMIVVLTNGGDQATRRAFARANLEPLVHRIISVDDLEHFKPSSVAYARALEKIGMTPEVAVLIASHGWDVRGALAAGMQAVFVERTEPVPEDLAKRLIASTKSLPEAVLAATSVDVKDDPLRTHAHFS